MLSVHIDRDAAASFQADRDGVAHDHPESNRQGFVLRFAGQAKITLDDEDDARAIALAILGRLGEDPPAEVTDAFEMPFVDQAHRIDPGRDRVRGAPRALFSLALRSGDGPPPTVENAKDELALGMQLLQGSKEGIKQLICQHIEVLWSAAGFNR